MSSYCCATCHHFQSASPDELRQHVTIGWCWWLIDHPGMKYEVPEWMLPRDLTPDGNSHFPVSMAADDGARCAQWRARLGRRHWTGDDSA